MVIDGRGKVYHLGHPIGRLGGFSAFDGRSFGAFGGAWQDWCARDGTDGKGNRLSLCNSAGGKWENWCAGDGVDKYSGQMWLCTYGGGGPISLFPPPWTEVGALARILVAGAWPDPEEVKPWSLLVMPVVRPWRYYYIVAIAKALSVTPFGVVGAVAKALGYTGLPIDQIPFVNTLQGLASLPGIGIVPGMTYPEQVVLPFMWPVVVAETMIRFGPQGTFDRIVKPLGVLPSALGALLGGLPGIGAYAIRQELEQPGFGGAPITRAILLALANNAGSLFDKFKDPITFRDPSTFSLLGEAIQNAASTATVSAGATQHLIRAFGQGLNTFAEPIGALLGSDKVPSNWRNKLTRSLFGVDESTFDQIRGDGAALRQRAQASGALGDLELVKIFVDAIVRFANEIVSAINKVINSEAIKWVFSGELAATARDLGSAIVGFFSGIGDSINLALNPPAVQAEATATMLRTLSAKTTVTKLAPTAMLFEPPRVSLPQMPVVKPPPPPAQAPKPQAKGVGGVTAAGAGVGLLIGGPPGGLIGAGAGLIYGLTRRPK